MQPDENQHLLTPYEYFQKFVTPDMISSLAENTNLYSVQKTGKCANTTVKELEQMVGMFFRMGLVRMASVRQYWESESSYEPVSGVMSRNRFELLCTMIHFINNASIDDQAKREDKLWKIRPWLNAMRKQCLEIVPEEHSSVDEMMCQYRGIRSPIRQYIKCQPPPWGFKMWARANSSGLLSDFDVYQGGDGTRTELGQGGDVVAKLTSTLPKHQYYKVYADNLFTRIPLLRKLADDGIYYTGTVRQNRLQGISMADESHLRKKSRGSYDYRVDEESNIAAVRWYDNRAVTMLSTTTCLDPIQTTKRWDKKQKKELDVPMPAVIRDYNQHMGGVDLLDSFLAKYRFRIKSRRWYIYLFWHMLSVGLVNAWLMHRRDHKLLNLPKNELLPQRKFQSYVASALVLVNASKKRSLPASSPLPLSKRQITNLPCIGIRKDKVSHWPTKAEKRGRCRLCEVNATTTMCSKCGVRLCFVDDRNCFMNFHN